MNDRLYNKFVLSNVCISKKYLPYKNKHHKIHKYFRFVSWIYLTYLNIKYRVILHKGKKIYPESLYNRQTTIDFFKSEIDKYDIVSRLFKNTLDILTF